MSKFAEMAVALLPMEFTPKSNTLQHTAISRSLGMRVFTTSHFKGWSVKYNRKVVVLTDQS